MQPSSKQVVLEYLRDKKFSTALDAHSGNGWLAEGLSGRATFDGIDLYATAPGYRKTCDAVAAGGYRELVLG